MILTEPHYTELPSPVIFDLPGIRVTHLLDYPPNEGEKEGWRWKILHPDDVKHAFNSTDAEIVEIHDDKECGESVLEEWQDHNPHASYAY
jgi:hypothetical protein